MSQPLPPPTYDTNSEINDVVLSFISFIDFLRGNVDQFQSAIKEKHIKYIEAVIADHPGTSDGAKTCWKTIEKQLSNLSTTISKDFITTIDMFPKISELYHTYEYLQSEVRHLQNKAMSSSLTHYKDKAQELLNKSLVAQKNYNSKCVEYNKKLKNLDATKGKLGEQQIYYKFYQEEYKIEFGDCIKKLEALVKNDTKNKHIGARTVADIKQAINNLREFSKAYQIRRLRPITDSATFRIPQAVIPGPSTRPDVTPTTARTSTPAFRAGSDPSATPSTSQQFPQRLPTVGSESPISPVYIAPLSPEGLPRIQPTTDPLEGPSYFGKFTPFRSPATAEPVAGPSFHGQFTPSELSSPQLVISESMPSPGPPQRRTSESTSSSDDRAEHPLPSEFEEGESGHMTLDFSSSANLRNVPDDRDQLIQHINYLMSQNNYKTAEIADLHKQENDLLIELKTARAEIDQLRQNAESFMRDQAAKDSLEDRESGVVESRRRYESRLEEHLEARNQLDRDREVFEKERNEQLSELEQRQTAVVENENRIREVLEELQNEKQRLEEEKGRLAEFQQDLRSRKRQMDSTTDEQIRELLDEIKDLKKRLRVCEDTRRRLENESESHTAEIERLGSELSQVVSERERLKQQLQEDVEANEELQSKISRLNRNIQILSQEKDDLRSQGYARSQELDERESYIAQMAERNEVVQSDLLDKQRQMDQERKAFERERNEQQSSLEQRQKAVRAAEIRVVDADAELEAEKRKIEELKRQLAHNEKILKQKEARIGAEKDAEIEMLSDQLNECQVRLIDCEDVKLVRLKTELENRSEKVSKLKKQLNRAVADSQNFWKQVQEHLEIIGGLRAEVVKLSDNINTITTERDNLNNEVAPLQTRNAALEADITYYKNLYDQDVGSLRSQLAELSNSEQTISELKNRIATLEQSVDECRREHMTTIASQVSGGVPSDTQQTEDIPVDIQLPSTSGTPTLAQRTRSAKRQYPPKSSSSSELSADKRPRRPPVIESSDSQDSRESSQGVTQRTRSKIREPKSADSEVPTTSSQEGVPRGFRRVEFETTTDSDAESQGTAAGQVRSDDSKKDQRKSSRSGKSKK